MACAPCKAALEKMQKEGVGPLKDCEGCKKRMARMQNSPHRTVRRAAQLIKPLHEVLVGTEKPRRVLGSK
jgi:hypothetical protein